MKKLVWPTVCLVVAFLAFDAAGATAEPGAAGTQQTADARSGAVAGAQPGLGSLMMVYGNRFVDAYFAAEGGNWGLAKYEIDKMHEIEDMAVAAQPKYAAPLKAFDKDHLQPLEQAVLAQEWSNFKTIYRKAANGCNECHKATGRGFIRFKIPFEAVEKHLDFLLKTDPSGKPQSQ
jgi:hypothetical protein